MSQKVDQPILDDSDVSTEKDNRQIDEQKQRQIQSQQIIEAQYQKCSTLYKMTEILKSPVKSTKDGRVNKIYFYELNYLSCLQDLKVLIINYFYELLMQNSLFLTSLLVMDSYKSSLEKILKMIIWLFRQMGCEEFQKSEPIMKQGDESNDKLYVIIDGKVGIVIAKDTNVFKKQKKIQLNNEEDEQVDIIQKTIEMYGTKVNELSKGDGFGEKALLLNPQEAKRNATIIALEKTTCLTILRKDFQHIQENFNRETQLKEQLLIQLMPFLKTITSSSTKEALMMYFKNQSASRGKYLTQEGKLGEYIYILQSGKITVEKKFLNSNNIYYSDYQTVKITEISEPTFIGEEILFIEQDVLDQMKFDSKDSKKKNSNSKTSTPKNLNRDKYSDNNKDWYQQNNTDTIPTENDENIQEYYKYTVRVESLVCKFFMISKQFFLTKFPKEILTDIKDQFIKKEQVRQKVYNSMKIHKQTFQSSHNDNIDPTFHRMNEISNKEIFSQMKPQMIENYNKVLFKKQEQVQNNLHTPELEVHEEDFNSDYRPNFDQKLEDIEKKKVLLQQRFKEATPQNSKNPYIKELPLHKLNQKKAQSEQTSPQISSRPTSQSKRGSTLSNFKQLSHRKKASRPASPFQAQDTQEQPQTPLDKLKQQRNVDGSLDPIELMEKVKYHKIHIEDISVADIMGENYDIFENQEASRLVTIKSPLPKEKKIMIDQLKEEQEKKMVAHIQEKIRKREVQSLDLGYLNSFQKQQHYKLVQLGKKKIDTPKSICRDKDSVRLQQDLKDKILQMKYKDKEQLEQDTQNLICNTSYLTPSNQKCRTMSSQFCSSDAANLDFFSDYVQDFNVSKRQITSASSIRQKKIAFSPSMSVRSNFSQVQLNNLINDKNFGSSHNLGMNKNQPDISGLNSLVNTSIFRLKTANDTSANQNSFQMIDNKRSTFSRGQKSKSAMRIQTSGDMPIYQFGQQANQQAQDSPYSKKLSIDLNNIQNNNLIGEANVDTPILKNNYYNKYSSNQKKIPLHNNNTKINDDSVSIIMQSPTLPVNNSSGVFKMNFEKKDSFQIESNGNLQPQVIHTRQFSCLTQIGQSASTTNSSYFNREKTQMGTQSPIAVAAHKFTSNQSSKFKFNDFLAFKQKQRQQLFLNRDSKVKKSLNSLPSRPMSSHSSSSYIQPNNDFVFNSFLK